MIIAARNESDKLEACMDSLARQKTSLPWEAIVVDNNSTDSTLSLAHELSQSRPWLRVLSETKPGTPAARNRGARESRGRILVFTDADCTFDPFWLEHLTRAFRIPTNLPIGAVGGGVESAFLVPGKPNIWERELDRVFRSWESDRDEKFPGFLPWAPTCNLTVSREIFEHLGGFDESWIQGYDSDFCWRLQVNGFCLAYEPAALVHHRRRHTGRAFFRQMRSYGFFNNSLFLEWHKSWGFSPARVRAARWKARIRRTLLQPEWRPLSLAGKIAHSWGGLQQSWKGMRGSPQFEAQRVGKFPRSKLLPEPFSTASRNGWTYWAHGEELVFFRPASNERMSLDQGSTEAWIRIAKGDLVQADEQEFMEQLRNEGLLR